MLIRQQYPPHSVQYFSTFSHLTSCINKPKKISKCACNRIGLYFHQQDSKHAVRLHGALEDALDCVMLWNKQQVFVS